MLDVRAVPAPRRGAQARPAALPRCQFCGGQVFRWPVLPFGSERGCLQCGRAPQPFAPWVQTLDPDVRQALDNLRALPAAAAVG